MLEICGCKAASIWAMRAAWSMDFFFVTVVVSCWDPPPDPDPEENLFDDPEEDEEEVNLLPEPVAEEPVDDEDVVVTVCLDFLTGFALILI